MADLRLSPTASVTISSLLQGLFQQLGIAAIEDVTTTTASSGDTTTALTVSSDATKRFAVGDLIAWVDDDFVEISRVESVGSATQITVRRGYLFTTKSTHTQPARFFKFPQFWGVQVQKALNDAIDSDLWPDLYAVYEAQLTYDPTSADWYEINSTAEEIIDAYQKPDSGNVDLLRARVSQPRYVDATLASTHNKAIKVLSAPDNNNTIFVQYLRRPAVGDLSAGMARVVEYGALRRLLTWMGTRALGRPDTPQSGILAPGQFSRDAAWYVREQIDIKAQEAAGLNRRFPRRMRHWRPNARFRHYTDNPR